MEPFTSIRTQEEVTNFYDRLQDAVSQERVSSPEYPRAVLALSVLEWLIDKDAVFPMPELPPYP